MKLTKNEDNNLILQLILSGSSLRATIPSWFVKERKLKERDLLIINKNYIQNGKSKIEVTG